MTETTFLSKMIFFFPSLQAASFNSDTSLQEFAEDRKKKSSYTNTLNFSPNISPNATASISSQSAVQRQHLTILPNILSPPNKSPALQPVIFVSPPPNALFPTVSQFCILGFVICSTLLSVSVKNFTSAMSFKDPNQSLKKKKNQFQLSLKFYWLAVAQWFKFELKVSDFLGFTSSTYCHKIGFSTSSLMCEFQIGRQGSEKEKRARRLSHFKELSCKPHITISMYILLAKLLSYGFLIGKLEMQFGLGMLLPQTKSGSVITKLTHKEFLLKKLYKLLRW